MWVIELLDFGDSLKNVREFFPLLVPLCVFISPGKQRRAQDTTDSQENKQSLRFLFSICTWAISLLKELAWATAVQEHDSPSVSSLAN